MNKKLRRSNILALIGALITVLVLIFNHYQIGEYLTKHSDKEKLEDFKTINQTINPGCDSPYAIKSGDNCDASIVIRYIDSEINITTLGREYSDDISFQDGSKTICKNIGNETFICEPKMIHRSITTSWVHIISAHFEKDICLINDTTKQKGFIVIEKEHLSSKNIYCTMSPQYDTVQEGMILVGRTQ